MRLNFNPRAPCGARHQIARFIRLEDHISILAPLAGRDGRSHRKGPRHRRISILAPLAGRDSAFARV